MTNFEYYKEEILKLINNNEEFTFSTNGKIIPCRVDVSLSECRSCVFYDCESCHTELFRWLYAEHKEQPKLTKKERLFCELVERGWICSDKNGSLFLYSVKPQDKNNHEWKTPNYCDTFDLNYRLTRNVMGCTFSFITWDDAEPWSIEDLLKLEVEE